MEQRLMKKWIMSLRKLICLISLLGFSTQTVAEEWIYTVRPGDNLWNLTERHLTSMKYVYRLQQLNQIQDPYVVPPGTRIRMPIAWTRHHTDNVYALVIAVHGAATIIRENSSMPVEVGMRLFKGDEIKSENDAFITIEFADKSRMRVQDNSRIRISQMEIFGDYGLVDTTVDLQQGRTENAVPSESDVNTRYRIKTPSAVSSVRGTDFRIGTLEEGKGTSSEVLTGLVQVSGGQRKINVSAGFGSMTRLGASPLPQVRLLPPPDLTDTPKVYESLPLVIVLKPLSGAKAYRAQIATDQEFRDLWTEFTTEKLPFRDGNIPDGNYWLRIRGIDATGIEGQDAMVAFALNARPEPPFVTAPLPGGSVHPEKPEFYWAAQSEATHYIVMISQTSDFTNFGFFDPAVKDNNLKLTESLTPGHYFWRIASVSADEGAGPFSDVMPFRVPFPGPALEDTKVDKTEMTFAWRAGAEGQHFHFQFARDKEFTHFLSDQKISASQITVQRPEGGNYYLRIKTIESDGFEGPWGPLQTIEVPYANPYWLIFPLMPLFELI